MNQEPIRLRLEFQPRVGVGGGLVASAPKYGIGIFSPALDPAGNSVAGLALLEMISRELKLDIFNY